MSIRERVARVAAAVSRSMPTASVLQLGGGKLLLVEGDEPFAEVLLVGRRLHVTVSVHCSPEWAAIAVAALTEVGRVEVSREVFVQASDGRMLRGLEAIFYWTRLMHLKPLLSPAFRSPPPYPC